MCVVLGSKDKDCKIIHFCEALSSFWSLTGYYLMLRVIIFWISSICFFRVTLPSSLLQKAGLWTHTHTCNISVGSHALYLLDGLGQWEILQEYTGREESNVKVSLPCLSPWREDYCCVSSPKVIAFFRVLHTIDSFSCWVLITIPSPYSYGPGCGANIVTYPRLVVSCSFL